MASRIPRGCSGTRHYNQVCRRPDEGAADLLIVPHAASTVLDLPLELDLLDGLVVEQVGTWICESWRPYVVPLWSGPVFLSGSTVHSPKKDSRGVALNAGGTKCTQT